MCRMPTLKAVESGLLSPISATGLTDDATGHSILGIEWTDGLFRFRSRRRGSTFDLPSISAKSHSHRAVQAGALLLDNEAPSDSASDHGVPPAALLQTDSASVPWDSSIGQSAVCMPIAQALDEDLCADARTTPDDCEALPTASSIRGSARLVMLAVWLIASALVGVAAVVSTFATCLGSKGES